MEGMFEENECGRAYGLFICSVRVERSIVDGDNALAYSTRMLYSITWFHIENAT